MQQKAIVSRFNLYLTKAVAGLLRINRFNGPSSGFLSCISTHRVLEFKSGLSSNYFNFFFYARHATIFGTVTFFMLGFSLSRSKQQDNRSSMFSSSSKTELCSPCLKMTQITLHVNGTVAGLTSFVLAPLFVRLLTWDFQQALVFFFQ